MSLWPFDSCIVLGASTEAGDGSYDLFVAIKAPGGGASNAMLSGEYTGASLWFPNGNDSALTTSLVSLSADGAGRFSAASLIGHAADQQDLNVEQSITNATFALNGDGSGTASFGSPAGLFGGDRDIFVSANGNYLIGFSTEQGGRDIFVAVKNFSGSASDSSWNGSFWIAEMLIGVNINFGGLVNSYTVATGALRSNGQGTAPLSQRQRFDSQPLDFGATQFYTIKADSTGQLAAFLKPAVTNMAIGATVEGTPQAFVGAQVLTPSNVSIDHGVFFGVRLPNITGDGVFVSPLGVLSAASFAPPTYPISGGALLSLGSGLAPSTEVARAIPLPTSLEAE